VLSHPTAPPSETHLKVGVHRERQPKLLCEERLSGNFAHAAVEGGAGGSGGGNRVSAVDADFASRGQDTAAVNQPLRNSTRLQQPTQPTHLVHMPTHPLASR